MKCSRRFCDRDIEADREGKKICALCTAKSTSRAQIRRSRALKDEAIRSIAKKILRQSEQLTKLLDEPKSEEGDDRTSEEDPGGVLPAQRSVGSSDNSDSD